MATRLEGPQLRQCLTTASLLFHRRCINPSRNYAHDVNVVDVVEASSSYLHRIWSKVVLRGSSRVTRV